MRGLPRYDEAVAPYILTIDGPAASGKSSVARGVAQALGIPVLSSGLLYRAATYLALAARSDLDDEAALLALLAKHTIVLSAQPESLRIDGQELGGALHTHEVDRAVSRVARHPGVRRWVNARLRDIPPPFVVEGRDMGRAVFPEAAYKFYLTASPEVRAARRLRERPAELDEMIEAIKARDALDRAQLAPADDAVHIDTSALTLEQVIEAIVAQVRQAEVACE